MNIFSLPHGTLRCLTHASPLQRVYKHRCIYIYLNICVSLYIYLFIYLYLSKIYIEVRPPTRDTKPPIPRESPFSVSSVSRCAYIYPEYIYIYIYI